MQARWRRPHRRWPAALSAVVIAAATPASAEDGFHPLDSALKAFGMKTQVGPMPDFVQQTHESAVAKGYLPIGAKPVDRALKPKTPAEVKAETAELDAARAAQLAGKRPKPVAAAPAKPAPRKIAIDR